VKLTQQDRVRGLDDERPKRRLIGVALLPSAATIGNLLCGILAMLCSLLSMRAEYSALEPRVVHPHLAAFFPSYLSVAAYLIMLAMLFDWLDGRLARITRRTSEFGAQLDSIADIVSFGAAPVLIFLTLLLRLAAPAEGDPVVGGIEWRLGLTCAMVYVSCAAILLARFNVENVKDESAQKKFSGLPVPGAAAGVVALLLLHEDVFYMSSADWAGAVRWAIGPAAFGLGLLMIGRVSYVHVVNIYLRREHPPSHLIILVVLIGIGWYSPQILMVVLASAYVFSGILLHLSHHPVLQDTNNADEQPPIELN